MGLNTQNVNLRMTAGFASQFPTDPIPQVALSGRSNVGKSSLINTLLGRKSLARVSSTPGKTITVNFYEVDKKLFLVDLPGYGFAARKPEDRDKWAALTDGYFTKNKNIDLVKGVVQLIDCRAGITKDDAMMLDWMNQSGIYYIVVITKIDKLNKTERAASIEKISNDDLIAEGTPIIPFSSLKGEGKQELWRAIADCADIRL
ncbi:MAG: YihA family ribosome biogenesis GTP-binding protein [Clostridia bacterium]|nr:YihA family ribosome biogenesis GTP-binding protein [Clostridia bacterium]MBR4032355.1 YihA family ribosome biogenesis GTP-binding protein [Clostridia bacterium]